MNNQSLKARTLSGFVWNGLDKVLQQLIVFIGGVLLARKLDETDFGVIGVLLIFVAVASVFQEGGFVSALIRKEDADEEDYNTVFCINIGVSVVLYLILFFSAPLISAFYENDSLTSIARFLFLSCIFNALPIVQYARMIKKIDYKTSAKISIITVTSSYLLALTFAYLGFGPWAIAVQTVSVSACRWICFMIFFPWKPTFRFSRSSFKNLFSFGSNILGTNLIAAFTSNLIPNLIGKFYSLSQTGLYTQAGRLYSPAESLINSIHSVTYPVLVEGKDRIKKLGRKMIRMTSFIACPAFMAIILIADSFIPVIIGDKWLPAVPILQILCFGGILGSLSYTHSHVMKVKGVSSYILQFELIKNLIMFSAAAIVILLKMNYLYLVTCVALGQLVNFILLSAAGKKMISYTYAEQLKDIMPYFGLSLISFTAGYLLRYLIDHRLVLLLAQTILFGSLYLFISWITGSAILKELILIIKTRKLDGHQP